MADNTSTITLHYLPQIIPSKWISKEHFREDEVAEILLISKRLLWDLRESGILTPINTSERRRVYTRGALEAYLQRLNSR